LTSAPVFAVIAHWKCLMISDQRIFGAIHS
jgi:hypothetical protein